MEPIFQPRNSPERMGDFPPKSMTKLTTRARDSIPTRSFALPGRRYPIEDVAHARNALARVAQDGTPAEQAAVRRKVHKLYPKLGRKS